MHDEFRPPILQKSTLMRELEVAHVMVAAVHWHVRLVEYGHGVKLM
jgi:hypothetical protein